ncbi:MAG: CHAT domain-containing tetratricopeptide repeat protein, partial [Vicinamibacterales bacterium]|nr:CHAT domain-containing tetratricopeptide repeat protein [Vicinamibacterales bacterium]
RERRVRDLTFLPEAGVWRIWNDASAGDRLAQRLLSLPDAERDAVIAAEPELLSDDALSGLTRALTQMRQAMSPRLLDVLALQGRLARAVGNSGVLARSLLDAGLIHQVTGNLEAAAPAFADAREVFVEAGDAAGVASCDMKLGNAAYGRRDYTAAFEYYQAALTAFEGLNDEPRTASLRHSLGNVYFMQGEFERAVDSYQQGLAIFERTEDPYSASRLLQALGQVHKETGNYAAAAAVWGKCAEVNLRTKDATGAAHALRSMGEVYRLQGDFSRALESHTRSLALWDQTPDVANRAMTLFGLGQVYASQRSFSRAVEWYEKALDLDQKHALEAGIARDLGGLAGAHLALGKPDVALDEYQRSLALREKLDDGPGVIWTLIHIGVLHGLEGRHQDALTVLQRSLDLATPAQDLNATCTATALQARSLLATGDTDASLAAAARAAEVATGLDLFDVVAHAQVTTGRVHKAAGRVEDARAAFDAALTALARVSAEPGAETFFSDRRGPFLAMVDLLVSENRGAEAFLWTERARQRALADLLGSEGLIVSKGLAPAERDSERTLRREARTLGVRIRRERLREKPDPARLEALQAEALRVQAVRGELRTAIYTAHPSLQVLRAQGAVAGVEAAAALLADDHTAVVSFVVSEARSWVFVLTRDALSSQATLAQVATLETTATDLAKAVDPFVRAVASNSDGVAETSRALRMLLLDPVAPTLAGKTRLIIIPDAFLWTVPFEALRAESGKYLVEDATVSYGISVTALAAMAAPSQARPARPTLVAVASPRLLKPAEERIALLRPPSAGPPDRPDEEVRLLGTLFGPAASRTLRSERANLSLIQQGVSALTILHLAVPAFVSNASPLYSAIALTPEDPADADGGLVELSDVLAWELPAQAVVLSRVEPSGGLLSEEGIAGLSWGLFVAGTPTVVANRWPLKDPAAAAMIPALYRAKLAPVAGRPSGRTLAESIQRAAKRQLAQPATQHPFYWAGLMAVGR